MTSQIIKNIKDVEEPLLDKFSKEKDKRRSENKIGQSFTSKSPFKENPLVASARSFLKEAFNNELDEEFAPYHSSLAKL